MDIENIRLFILTYQKRSFAAVARELDLAPSSVSRTINSLEKQLCVRLFHRNTRALSPTQDGEDYYSRVVPLIEELDSVNQSYQGSSEPFGKVRISVSMSFGQIVLVPLLKSFYEQYSQIELELILSDSNVDLVEEQVDVAIRHGKLRDSSLVARKLIDVNYQLVASPGYLSGHKAIQHPSDLSSHQVIGFNYKEFSKQWCFSHGPVSEVVTVNPFLKISNATAIRDCAVKGMGVALLADWTVKDDIATGNLTPLLNEWLISGEIRQSAIWVVQPSRTFVPQKVTAFIHFLYEHINHF
jgi:DNA-binding transcriptional LysR family regulator